MWPLHLGLMGIFARAGEESVRAEKEASPRGCKEETGQELQDVFVCARKCGAGEKR